MAALADGRVVSASSDRVLRVLDLGAEAAVVVFTLDAPVLAWIMLSYCPVRLWNQCTFQ